MSGPDRLSNKSPLTPRHVSVSLKLMSIWHAHYILSCKSDDSEKDNVSIKGLTLMVCHFVLSNRFLLDLRKLVRLVSQYAGEKSPTKVLNELDRIHSLNDKFTYDDLQKMLVNMYR